MPRPTQDTAGDRPLRIRGCHALRPRFPAGSPQARFSKNSRCGPTTPLSRFGLFPFRSPLLRESLLISLPVLLRWFTSHSAAPAGCLLRLSGCMPCGMRVTPFGNPRITGYVLLPAACRSLSRPSSPCSSTGIRHEPITAWPYPLSRARPERGHASLSFTPSLLSFSCQRTAPPSLKNPACAILIWRIGGSNP